MKMPFKTSAYRKAVVCLGFSVIFAPGTAVAEDDVTIGVAMNRQAERRWAVDREAMEAEAAKLGVKLIFQYANSDPSLQTSQVENLLSQQVDALILVPVDREAAGALVKSAQADGIPVVGYDGGTTTAKLDYFVTRDNASVGTLQADAAIAFAGNGNYAIFKGDSGNDVAQTIAGSYEKVFKEHADAKIVFDQFISGWSPSTAQANAENVLSANNDQVNAFVVTNDGMATGVAQAIRSRNLAGKVFLSGLDGETANLRLIAEGVQTMTAWTDLVDHGRAAVRAAAALVKNEVPEHDVMLDLSAGEVPTHLVPISSINKDNLCKFVTTDAPKGWTSVEEVFGSADACK
ncbi:substrate-binding domain-containing protein [Mesorhizobium sp. 1M-11]|uniref:sugar ABC transporter substrate-binding protein n=1 Tax=Mesorhizobium sp. 1M-11 TaxID=1529006 RepID=UPI0009E9619E|nr:substrate-binding domain-containing protein [Mesorhizobium sp. 1M-11]